MSLNSDIQTIENIIGFAVIVIFVIIYNIAIIGFLFFGIRSLMKKNLNFPPRKSKWAKANTLPVCEWEFEVAGEAESANMYNDLQYHMTGMRYKTTPKHTARYCKLKYEYDGQTYVTKTMRYDSGMKVYCRRDNPEITKTYIPHYPMSAAAAVSSLFLAGCMIFMELVFILN